MSSVKYNFNESTGKFQNTGFIPLPLESRMGGREYAGQCLSTVFAELAEILSPAAELTRLKKMQKGTAVLIFVMIAIKFLLMAVWLLTLFFVHRFQLIALFAWLGFTLLFTLGIVIQSIVVRKQLRAFYAKAEERVNEANEYLVEINREKFEPLGVQVYVEATEIIGVDHRRRHNHFWKRPQRRLIIQIYNQEEVSVGNVNVPVVPSYQNQLYPGMENVSNPEPPHYQQQPHYEQQPYQQPQPQYQPTYSEYSKP